MDVFPVLSNGRSYGSMDTANDARETRPLLREESCMTLDTILSNEIETSNQNRGFRYSGMLYTLLAANLFPINSTLMKLFGQVHPMTMTLYASPMEILVTMPFICCSLKSNQAPVTANLLPWREHKMELFLTWLRAIASTLLFYGLMVTYRYISVADAKTVIAASVVTINLFGWMCFGESCGYVPIVVAVAVLCGIGVITRPPIITGAESFDEETLIGVGLALSCMIFVTIIALVLRQLSNVNHGVLNMSVYIFAFLVTLPLAVSMGHAVMPDSTWELIVCLAIGGIEALGNTCLALALKNEEAGIVAFVRTSEVVFTFVWQWIILGKVPDSISYIGAAIVFSGVIVISLRRLIKDLDEGSTMRRRLKIFLY